MSRRRKAGPREPNGRLQRASAGETAWQAKLPVLLKRCELLGWSPSLDALKAADRYGGTFPGFCYLKGALNLRQYEAAEAFAKARTAYLRAIDAPAETPAVASYGGTGGRNLAPERPERDRAAIAAYGAILDAAFPWDRAALHMIVHSQITDIGAVCDALDAIANHLRLEWPPTQFERAA